MKRLMPDALITFLQNNRNCLRADLFSIYLPTGQTLNVTSGGWDITVPQGMGGWQGPTTTFYSVTYGNWTRGKITSEATNNLSSNTMSLTCSPLAGDNYPGLSIGILNAALNGLFDQAQVTVYTVYMPSDGYGNVSYGVETKFFGYITKITRITRVLVEFETADPFYLLNMKIPTRTMGSNCSWGFGDSNCNPPGGAAFFTTDFTADGTSTQWILNPTVTTGHFATANYFTQGVVTCLTGLNAGLSQTVKIHGTAAPYLYMMVKWLLPVAAGDTFSVIAGCDKSLGTCSAKFNNLPHFSGFPFIPVPTAAL